VFSWIWRHLPFGLTGRIVGSLLIVAGLAALMWYQVFPNIEQYMPFTDGQVTSDTGGAGADSVDPTGGPTSGPTGGPSLPADDVIPYSTTSNNPEPSATR
jgi:hypothetical protein